MITFLTAILSIVIFVAFFAAIAQCSWGVLKWIFNLAFLFWKFVFGCLGLLFLFLIIVALANA